MSFAGGRSRRTSQSFHALVSPISAPAWLMKIRYMAGPNQKARRHLAGDNPIVHRYPSRLVDGSVRTAHDQEVEYCSTYFIFHAIFVAAHSATTQNSMNFVPALQLRSPTQQPMAQPRPAVAPRPRGYRFEQCPNALEFGSWLLGPTGIMSAPDHAASIHSACCPQAGGNSCTLAGRGESCDGPGRRAVHLVATAD
jgi:hypothetical protein